MCACRGFRTWDGPTARRRAAFAQWPKVNQLTFTKSAGWPLVKVR